MTVDYNPETQRLAKPVLFGWAVYTCRPDDSSPGRVLADRYGLVKDQDDAEAWVRGDDPIAIASLITEKPTEFIENLGEFEMGPDGAIARVKNEARDDD